MLPVSAIFTPHILYIMSDYKLNVHKTEGCRDLAESHLHCELNKGLQSNNCCPYSVCHTGRSGQNIELKPTEVFVMLICCIVNMLNYFQSKSGCCTLDRDMVIIFYQ